MNSLQDILLLNGTLFTYTVWLQTALESFLALEIEMFELQSYLNRDRAGNIKQFTRHSLSEWNTVHFYSLVTDFTREFSTNALGIEMFEQRQGR